MSNRRHTIIFHGQVQGVGFRFTTKQIAQRFPVTGYVRNVADGTVELVMEGPAEQTTSMLGAIMRRMDGFVSEATESVAPADGSFTGFDIRR